jgi:hypothetical protein
MNAMMLRRPLVCCGGPLTYVGVGILYSAWRMSAETTDGIDE